MSKYIKLEDAINAYNQAVTTLVKSEMEEFDLGDFTECQFNTTQIKLIARMITSLPTIEVSEDAISRATVLEIYSDLYWMDERLLNFKNELDKVYDKLRTAPSVVPSRAEANELLRKSLSDAVLKQQYLEKWDGKLPHVQSGDSMILDIGSAEKK